VTAFWIEHQLGIVVFLAILLLIALSNLLTLRRLSDYPTAQQFPRVSILVPARNEQAVIGECVRSLLAQDYPDFQVLVLDDHSTDGTRDVLATLAQTDTRLRVLSGDPLPNGWLGKQWACHQLAQAATGELVLFTDADTIHHPHALRAGVAALQAERADLLTAFLYQRTQTWGEHLTVPTIFWCFFSFLPLALAYRLRIPALSLTNGQWMLFRRAAYQAIGGHAAVRSSPIDDIALGRRVRAQGLQWRVVDAGEYVACRMYTGFQSAIEGFSKNLFAVFEFRLVEYLFVWMWLTLVTLEPLGVIMLWAFESTRAIFDLGLAALAVVEMLALWSIAVTRLRFPFYLVFLYPLLVVLLALMALRSMLWTVTGRLTWKGRKLPRPRVRLV
jgi:chlorobactene glucosyltransferase